MPPETTGDEHRSTADPCAVLEQRLVDVEVLRTRSACASARSRHLCARVRSLLQGRREWPTVES